LEAQEQDAEEECPPQDQEEEEEYEKELDIVEDSETEEQPRPRIRMNRELSNSGVIPKASIPREVRNMNTSYNTTFTDQVNLTLTSDPGEPKAIKEVLTGPDREKCIELINEK
jgi:hypothetical protein